MSALVGSGTDTPQTGCFILVAERVRSNSTPGSTTLVVVTGAKVVAATAGSTSTVGLIVQTRSRRKTQLLLFVAGVARAITIRVLIADSGVPGIVLQTSAGPTTAGIPTCTISAGFLVRTSCGALVAKLGELLADPFERTSVSRCRIV
jgi:hypothetical protein